MFSITEINFNTKAPTRISPKPVPIKANKSNKTKSELLSFISFDISIFSVRNAKIKFGGIVDRFAIFFSNPMRTLLIKIG